LLPVLFFVFLKLQTRAWKTPQSLQVPRPLWFSTALWRPAPLQATMAWAQGQQLRPWLCLCWQEWASSRGLRVDPLTLSWLHSLNLPPDDEQRHRGPDSAHHPGVEKTPTFPDPKVQISHPHLPRFFSPHSNLPAEPSCCGLELSSSLLVMDWNFLRASCSLCHKLQGLDSNIPPLSPPLCLSSASFKMTFYQTVRDCVEYSAMMNSPCKRPPHSCTVSIKQFWSNRIPNSTQGFTLFPAGNSALCSSTF